MSGEVVQAQYEQLDTVAQRFGNQSQASTELYKQIERCVRALQNGGWQGRGAVAFFTEMDSKIFPALHRLSEALRNAQATTLHIKKIMQAAEEDASAPFRGGTLAQSANSGATNPTNLGNVASATPSAPATSGPFKVGPPERPNITHDNGFLDRFAPREADLSDRLALLKWRTLLEGSEAVRPDLADANAAYRHFLDGNGKDRQFSYERFIENDPNGKTAFNNLVRDAQTHAERLGTNQQQFSMTSRSYQIGGDDARFPYPATENWQKAIGGHAVWTSADVQVSGTGSNRTYTMTVTLHAEDRYNFNPGAQDIATGIPDDANGTFEITGLAHQYTNYGEVTRVVTWREGQIDQADIVDVDSSRNRRPQDNRRARNRI